MAEEAEARVAAWTLFWVLFSFKLITATVVFMLYPSVGAAIFIFVFHWFWFLPIIAVGLTVTVAWRRLRRVRARRAALLRAEFLIEPAGAPGVVQGVSDAGQ